MRTIGHGRRSASAPDPGLSSPAPSRSDHISAFLPRGLCLGVSASGSLPRGLCLGVSAPGSLPRGLCLGVSVSGSLSRGLCLGVSVSGSLPQVLLGLPLCLFLRGFQVRACFVMLLAGFQWVWPVQPHFHLRSCEATGS